MLIPHTVMRCYDNCNQQREWHLPTHGVVAVHGGTDSERRQFANAVQRAVVASDEPTSVFTHSVDDNVDTTLVGLHLVLCHEKAKERLQYESCRVVLGMRKCNAEAIVYTPVGTLICQAM